MTPPTTTGSIEVVEESPWRPGSWHPGRLRLSDSVGLTIGLIIVSLVRGFDYLTPNPVSATSSLTVVEGAFPLPVWGIAFMAPALLLALAAGLRIHAGVWIGHWVLAIAYTALAVGLGAEYVTRPMLDGIRSATAMTIPAYLHLTIALRTGWRPIRWISND